MNFIWSCIIIISIVFAFITGNIKQINDLILTSAYDSLISFGLIASNLILWNGILEIGLNNGFLNLIAKLIKPLVKPIFRTKNEEILKYTSLNIACNMFGLSAASTPFALKALTLMDLENNNMHKETKDMATLTIINVCGASLIPSSLLTLLANYNATKTPLIIFYVILFSFFTTFILVLMDRIFRK